MGIFRRVAAIVLRGRRGHLLAKEVEYTEELTSPECPSDAFGRSEISDGSLFSS